MKKSKKECRIQREEPKYKVFTLNKHQSQGMQDEYSVVFGDDAGRLWCLDPFFGFLKPFWGNAISFFDTFSNSPIRSSPLVEGGSIYFYCQDMNVYSIDMATGNPRWIQPINGIGTALPDDELVCTARNVGNVRYIIISSTAGLAYIQDSFPPMIVELVKPQIGLFPKTNPANNPNFLFVGYILDSMAMIAPFPTAPPFPIVNQLLFPILDKANSSPSVTTANDVFFTTNDLKINWMRDVGGGAGLYFNSTYVNPPYPKERLTSVAIAYKKIYFASTSCTVFCYECSDFSQPPPPPFPNPNPKPCPGCPLTELRNLF